MSFNFKEDKERQENIKGFDDSIKWHAHNICFALSTMRNTEEYEKAVEKLDKIVEDLSALDKYLIGKTGWK